MKILLVEDEAMSAMFLKMVLTKAGHIVAKVVASGEEAVDSVIQDSPDLILMDISLAGKIDGIEAASRIKNIHNIPVIFMTGYPDKTHRERAESVNPVNYFIKPIETSTLLTAIGSIV